jgi:hypothetical protein
LIQQFDLIQLFNLIQLFHLFQPFVLIQIFDMIQPIVLVESIETHPFQYNTDGWIDIWIDKYNYSTWFKFLTDHLM